MPEIKFLSIYNKIKSRINANKYSFQEDIPSESILTKEFKCSRNTIRRAIKMLIDEGYLYSKQGKRVKVIYKDNNTHYKMGIIESFSEASKRNKNKKVKTKILQFSEIIVDESLHKISDLPVGEKAYYIVRLRYINNIAAIIDINYLLKSIVGKIDKNIVKKSIYSYLENNVSVEISYSNRILKFERYSHLEKKYFDIEKYNCSANLYNKVYDSNGTLFEFTISKHQPDFFSFEEIALRKKI